MPGLIVKVKYKGKFYEIPVDDIEISIKFAEIEQNIPQIYSQLTEIDVAEMVAYNKISHAVALNENKQHWVRNQKCFLCGAKHRMLTAVFDNSILANIDHHINFEKRFVCEECFENEFITCKKCKRAFYKNEIIDDYCSLCQDQTPLIARRAR